MEHRPALLWATPSIDFALGRGRRKLLTVMQGIRDTVGVCQDALSAEATTSSSPGCAIQSSNDAAQAAGTLSCACCLTLVSAI